MITPQGILFGFAIPAAIALIGLLAAAFLWRSKTGKPFAVTLIGLIPAGAYAFGFWKLYGWPGWPPTETTNWLLHFAVIAGVVGVFSGISVWLGWAGRLVLAVVLPWLLLGPIIEYDWALPVAIGYLAAYAAAMLLQMAALEQIAHKVETARFLLIATAVVGTTALTMSLSGSLALAKMAGILAMLLLIAFLACRCFPAEKFTVYLVPLIATITAGAWLSGHYYATLNPINAALLYSSVLFAWLGLWLRLDRLPAWSRLILHAILTTLPLAIAFTRALTQFLQNESNGYY